MYNNSYYSHSKLGVSTKKIHKARGKSCGYYMKIVFFFSSLIQTLIIVSLVLFLIYGQPEDSAAEKRLQELDPVHNELKSKYGYLLEEHRNLTRKMNKTHRQMEFMHGNITMLRKLANQSAAIIMELRISSQNVRCPPPCNCPRPTPTLQCPKDPRQQHLEHQYNHLKDWHEIVKRNFSDTVNFLNAELKTARDEKLALKQAKISLGQDKAILEDGIKLFKRKCQDDFIRSLEGIPDITKMFREKIDTLFPHMIPFHITCDKQHEQLEQIRNNCSSLSAQVENKFQPYLNNIGDKVSDLMRRSTLCQSKTTNLERVMGECKRNLSSQEEKHYNQLRDTVNKYEKQEEQYLLDIKKLDSEKQLLHRTMRLKESEIKMLNERINTSLPNSGHRLPSPKPVNNPLGGIGTGTGGSSYSVQPGPGSPFGTGTSRSGTVGSSSSSGSSGSGFNTGSYGTGSSRSGTGIGSSSSSGSPSTGFNTGSLGTGPTRSGSGGTGIGSSSSSGSPSAGFNIDPLGTGTSRSGTGIGSSSSSGSSGSGFHTGSLGTGPTRSGTVIGSSSSSGSSSGGFNTGSYGTGTSRSGTGIGSSSSSGSSSGGFNTGSYGAGTGAGHSGTGFSSTGSMGPSGAGFGNTGSFGGGGSRTPYSGTGSSTLGLGNTGSRTGSSGTGFGGTSSYGNFGSGGQGAGRMGMGASGMGRTGNMGMYGASDPISKHLRELEKYINPEHRH